MASYRDTDRRGHGIPVHRGRIFLFVDWRHIQAGQLSWSTPDGQRLPLNRPPEPVVAARSAPAGVPYGIRLQAQPAHKGEPLPLGGYLNYLCLENGVYRAWGFGEPPGTVRYRESADGYEWREPELGLVEIEGSAANNAVYQGRPDHGSFDGLGLMVDEQAPSSARYKLVHAARPRDPAELARLTDWYYTIHPRSRHAALEFKNARAMYGAVSPDGLRWTPLPEPLLPHFSDTLVTLYRDPWIERYVMYTRQWLHGRRWIGRGETADFAHWHGVEPAVGPPLDGHPSDDWYTNGRTEYPGAPEYHLMFPMCYHRADESSLAYLYVSQDGIYWDRVPGGPVLTHGDPGAFDGEFIVPGSGMVPLGTERVGILYAGTPWPHKYPRWSAVLASHRGTAWATWPRGRLCAVVAPERGEFTTFAMVPTARQLRLNYRARRGGCVRVGLQVEGKPVEGHDVADCDPLWG
ncbi:MAG: hypothetical protein AB1505_30180, partial [Candidatus Latescibacterota bacterium]